MANLEYPSYHRLVKLNSRLQRGGFFFPQKNPTKDGVERVEWSHWNGSASLSCPVCVIWKTEGGGGEVMRRSPQFIGSMYGIFTHIWLIFYHTWMLWERGRCAKLLSFFWRNESNWWLVVFSLVPGFQYLSETLQHFMAVASNERCPVCKREGFLQWKTLRGPAVEKTVKVNNSWPSHPGPEYAWKNFKRKPRV